jgi:hypothetical protein
MRMTRDKAVVWCLHEFIYSPLNVLESASCHPTSHTLGWAGYFEYSEKSSSYVD